MIEQEISELLGGSDLTNLIEALPPGSAPHVVDDFLWALASSDPVLSGTDNQPLLSHVCSCRRCFSLLFQYRQEQLLEAHPNQPALAGTKVWERWDALRVAFLISLGAVGLKLRVQPFRLRMRDGGPVESDELLLRPGDSFPIEMDAVTVAMRLVDLDANRNTFRFALDLVESATEFGPDDLRIQVRGESGNLLFSQPFKNRTVAVDDLPVAAYDLLVIDSRNDQLIGSIKFQPTTP